MSSLLRHLATRWGVQRGAGSALTVAIVLVIVVAMAVGCWQISWLNSGRRARGVADLVALGAAEAYDGGGDACDVAVHTASRNGADLVSCEVSAGSGEFIVDVRIRMELVPQIPGAPSHAEAASRAGVVAP